jgi:hypothetical protein
MLRERGEFAVHPVLFLRSERNGLEEPSSTEFVVHGQNFSILDRPHPRRMTRLLLPVEGSRSAARAYG